MKNIILTSFLFLTSSIMAQVVKSYDPSKQRTKHIQYFKPTEEHLFSGDGMPYFHNNTFYLYWLLDEGHHSGLDGLGGHQWSLSTSKDLINWEHHPVALGIDEDWEKSICTGSIIAEKDNFYAFYSTRVKKGEKVHEQLSYAISTDGGHTYKKQKPNPFYYPPQECAPHDFRDPKIFKDKEGNFHLFISGNLREPLLKGYGGYLVHLVSKDIQNWKEVASPLKGQKATPECSDYFKWNDWYYLLYSIDGYTYYLKSKQAHGSWEYPESQALAEYWAVVYKTAEFTNNRRIAVAYTPYRKNSKNDGERIWGGNIMFRELSQQEDGTLATHFLEEVIPPASPLATPQINILSDKNTTIKNNEISIDALADLGLAYLPDLPQNYRISMKIEPDGNYDELGMIIRAIDTKRGGYKLEINPNKQTVLLQNTMIDAVKSLRQPFVLDMIVYDEFIDICIDGKRCILNRMPEHEGRNLYFYLKNGKAKISEINIHEIK